MKIVYVGTHVEYSQYMDGGSAQLTFKPGEPQEVSDAHGTELIKRSDFVVAGDSDTAGGEPQEVSDASEGEGSEDDTEKPKRNRR